MVGVIARGDLVQWDGSFYAMVVYLKWLGSVGGLSPWDGVKSMVGFGLRGRIGLWGGLGPLVGFCSIGGISPWGGLGPTVDLVPWGWFDSVGIVWVHGWRGGGVSSTQQDLILEGVWFFGGFLFDEGFGSNGGLFSTPTSSIRR